MFKASLIGDDGSYDIISDVDLPSFKIVDGILPCIALDQIILRERFHAELLNSFLHASPSQSNSNIESPKDLRFELSAKEVVQDPGPHFNSPSDDYDEWQIKDTCVQPVRHPNAPTKGRKADVDEYSTKCIGFQTSDGSLFAKLYCGNGLHELSSQSSYFKGLLHQLPKVKRSTTIVVTDEDPFEAAAFLAWIIRSGTSFTQLSQVALPWSSVRAKLSVKWNLTRCIRYYSELAESIFEGTFSTKNMTSFQISGVADTSRALNGVYDLSLETCFELPAYQHRDDKDLWLVSSRSQSKLIWNITDSKGKCSTYWGFAYLCCDDSPADSPGVWRVQCTADNWESQPFVVATKALSLESIRLFWDVVGCMLQFECLQGDKHAIKSTRQLVDFISAHPELIAPQFSSKILCVADLYDIISCIANSKR